MSDESQFHPKFRNRDYWDVGPIPPPAPPRERPSMFPHRPKQRSKDEPVNRVLVDREEAQTGKK